MDAIRSNASPLILGCTISQGCSIMILQVALIGRDLVSINWHQVHYQYVRISDYDHSLVVTTTVICCLWAYSTNDYLFTCGAASRPPHTIPAQASPFVWRSSRLWFPARISPLLSCTHISFYFYLFVCEQTRSP